MITCNFTVRSITFMLFFATRILRLFTALPNPCKRGCEMLTSTVSHCRWIQTVNRAVVVAARTGERRSNSRAGDELLRVTEKILP